MKKGTFYKWIIALLVILIFAVTTPRKVEDFGEESKYYKVNNYLVFSTCSAHYSNGKEWRVHYFGILGFKIKVKR